MCMCVWGGVHRKKLSLKEDPVQYEQYPHDHFSIQVALWEKK